MTQPGLILKELRIAKQIWIWKQLDSLQAPNFCHLWSSCNVQNCNGIQDDSHDEQIRHADFITRSVCKWAADCCTSMLKLCDTMHKKIVSWNVAFLQWTKTGTSDRRARICCCSEKPNQLIMCRKGITFLAQGLVNLDSPLSP